MTQQHTSYQGNIAILYIRSCLLFAGILFVTILLSVPIFIAVLLPFRTRYKIAQLWAHCSLFLAKSICGINYTVTGLDELQREGSAIVLCKHQSAWETIALMALFPPQSILLKKSLLWIPFWGWAMATMKPIAINRNTPKEALSQLLKKGAQRLAEGYWVVMFPEGTRTAPGEQRKFSGSGSLLAQRTGCPVIPVAHNAGEFWPRYSFLKYPGTIQLRIGPAISPENRKSKDINAEAESWINDTMQEIETTIQSL